MGLALARCLPARGRVITFGVARACHSGGRRPDLDRRADAGLTFRLVSALRGCIFPGSQRRERPAALGRRRPATCHLQSARTACSGTGGELRFHPAPRCRNSGALARRRGARHAAWMAASSTSHHGRAFASLLQVEWTAALSRRWQGVDSDEHISVLGEGLGGRQRPEQGNPVDARR